MATNEANPEPKSIGDNKSFTGNPVYHWVYETPQGQDIDILVTPTGLGRYSIETPWYRAQMKTYDILDTAVRFCRATYGEGKLIVDLS